MKQVYNISVSFLKYVPVKAVELLFPKTCRRCASRINNTPRKVEYCGTCEEARKNIFSEIIL